MLDTTAKQSLTSITSLIQQTSINFDDELREYLPKSHWVIIKDFKTTLSRELARFTR